MTDHPISLPSKLWDEWIEDGCDGFLAACEAARWGADQELEACCEWLKGTAHVGIELELLNARRPKPPSKSQALKALERNWTDGYIKTSSADIIRRALELLPE